MTGFVVQGHTFIKYTEVSEVWGWYDSFNVSESLFCSSSLDLFDLKKKIQKKSEIL